MKKIAMLLAIPVVAVCFIEYVKQRKEHFEKLGEEWFRRSEAIMGINRES